MLYAYFPKGGSELVKINGKDADCDEMTVSSYLAENGYDKSKVAVEINGGIVPRPQYDTTLFSDGDTVEIVSFVGGG